MSRRVKFLNARDKQRMLKAMRGKRNIAKRNKRIIANFFQNEYKTEDSEVTHFNF